MPRTFEGKRKCIIDFFQYKFNVTIQNCSPWVCILWGGGGGIGATPTPSNPHPIKLRQKMFSFATPSKTKDLLSQVWFISFPTNVMELEFFAIYCGYHSLRSRIANLHALYKASSSKRHRVHDTKINSVCRDCVPCLRLITIQCTLFSGTYPPWPNKGVPLGGGGGCTTVQSKLLLP